MRNFLLTATAMLFALALTADAQAGALDLLTPDGQIDELADRDFESVVDMNTVGLSVGDVFVGMFDLATINGVETDNTDGDASPGPYASFTGVLVAKISAYDVATGRITFTNLSNTEYDELTGAIAGPLNTRTGGGLSTLGPRVNENSALLVYDDSTFPFVLPGTATNNTTYGTTAADWAGVKAALGTATSGTKVLEFGFDPLLANYAQAQLITGTTGTGPDNPLSPNFKFSLALNLTDNGTNLGFLDVNGSGFTTIDGADLPATALHISGYTNATDIGLSGTGSSLTGDFTYRTHADLRLNPIPEPASLTLLSLGVLGMAGARLRRRKAA